MNEEILVLERVSKHFPVNSFRRHGKLVHAMDEISFSLKGGEVLAIVGESGSGKTTTANVIARIYKQTSGRVTFEGREISKNMSREDELRYHKKVQMIFQDPFGALNPTRTVGRIMERPFVIHKIAGRKKNVKDRIDEILIQVGLEPPEQFTRKFPHELSGGQRQRVSIARAFAVEPELILADEPTSMLDVSNRMSIMNMMLYLKESHGVSFIYITHDLAGARYMSDRIIVMYAGMIMEIGPAEKVINGSFHPYTRLLKSAAPSPEMGLKRKRLITGGDIPSLIDPPDGCRFHPRCPFMSDTCSLEVPVMKKIDEGHYVRCIL
jgi:peptide/nickel transport system ATP-binding protein